MLLGCPWAVDVLPVLVFCELETELFCPDVVPALLLLCTLVVGFAVLLDCRGVVDELPVLPEVCEIDKLGCPRVVPVLLLLL